MNRSDCDMTRASDEQTLPNPLRLGLPTILSVSTICGQRSCLKLTTAPNDRVVRS